MGYAYVSAVPVLQATTPQTADVTTPAFAVAVNGDNQQPFDQDFEAVFLLTWTPTGVTTPSFNARVEVSHDGGATWIPDAGLAQQTSAGTFNVRIAAKPGPLVRGFVDVGGTGGSHSWQGQILLASNALFKLVPV